MNGLKTAIQAVVFWVVFLGAVPLGIRAVEVGAGFGSWTPPSPLAAIAGILLFAAASTLSIASARVMAVHGEGTPLPLDPTRRLVVRGPYRHVRNPMAIAGIAQGVAVGILLGSWAVVAYALAGAVAWQVLVRPWEEADLRRRFGAAYEHYAAAVPCWLPGRRYVGPDGLEPPTSSV